MENELIAVTGAGGFIGGALIAGIKLKRSYDLSAPKGVAGRNSGNTLIRKYLNWEPSLPLRTGMERTYAWIYDRYVAREQGLAAAGAH
jgi:nucleoside-diphosphate-sugar epimerase